MGDAMGLQKLKNGRSTLFSALVTTLSQIVLHRADVMPVYGVGAKEQLSVVLYIIIIY